MELTPTEGNSLEKLLAVPKKKRGRPKKIRPYVVGRRSLNMRELVPFMKVGMQIAMWCAELWPNSLSKNIFNYYFMQSCSSRAKFPCIMEMNRRAVHPIIDFALAKANLSAKDVINRPDFVPGHFNIVSPTETTWTVSLFDVEIKDGKLVYNDVAGTTVTV